MRTYWVTYYASANSHKPKHGLVLGAAGPDEARTIFINYMINDLQAPFHRIDRVDPYDISKGCFRLDVTEPKTHKY